MLNEYGIVARALVLLSDAAFKLYIHLCLEADRYTGRAAIEPAMPSEMRYTGQLPLERGHAPRTVYP
jgi:hypothetical protein